MDALYQLSYAGRRRPASQPDASLVAGAGFEPDDLRVMSPTSYQTAPPRGMRHSHACRLKLSLVEGAGFEPAKATPTDLQSAPFDRFGTPPYLRLSPPAGPAGAAEPELIITSPCSRRQGVSTWPLGPIRKPDQGHGLPTWSQRRGSNPQPTAYKAAALPLSYTGTPSAVRAPKSIPPAAGRGQGGRQAQRYISLSRFSRYRSSLRFTRCKALSMDLTCRDSWSAISWYDLPSR